MSVSHRSTEHSDATNRPDPGAPGTTLRNGLVGGVVGVLFSFLPLSTVLGGGVAGYLERDDARRGPAAGAVSGLIAFIPYLLVGLYLGLSPTVTLPGPDLGLSPTLVIAGTMSFAFVYTVGLGVFGSLLGGYLRDRRGD